MKYLANIFLSGFLFLGQYFDSNLTDLEYRPVEYRAGVHLDIKTVEKGPVLFVEDETLISGYADGNFNPIQINYKIGLSQRMGNFEAIIMNECKHLIDNTQGKRNGQDYKLIELRYHLK